MNKKLIILTFGILFLSLTFVSASENKIWFGRNESNPSQMIPILLSNIGKLKTDLNLVNITAGTLSLGGVPISVWGDIPDFLKLDGSTPMQGNANFGFNNAINISTLSTDIINSTSGSGITVNDDINLPFQVDINIDNGQSFINYANGRFGENVVDTLTINLFSGKSLVINKDGSGSIEFDGVSWTPIFPVGTLGTSSQAWHTAYLGTVDLGTNTITDGSMVGSWDMSGATLSNLAVIDNGGSPIVVNDDLNLGNNSILAATGYFGDLPETVLVGSGTVYDWEIVFPTRIIINEDLVPSPVPTTNPLTGFFITFTNGSLIGQSFNIILAIDIFSGGRDLLVSDESLSGAEDSAFDVFSGFITNSGYTIKNDTITNSNGVIDFGTNDVITTGDYKQTYDDGTFQLTGRGGFFPAFIGDSTLADFGGIFEFYTKDGDGSKEARLRLFGKGSGTSADIHLLNIAWDKTKYNIWTEAAGAESIKDLEIRTGDGANQGQFRLKTDGSLEHNLDNSPFKFGVTNTDMQLSSDGTNGIINVATLLNIQGDTKIDGKLNVSESIEYNGTLITHSPFLTYGAEEEKYFFADYITETTGFCRMIGRNWDCDGNNTEVLNKIQMMISRDTTKRECKANNYSYDRNGCFEMVKYSATRGEVLETYQEEIMELVNVTYERFDRDWNVVEVIEQELQGTGVYEDVDRLKDNCGIARGFGLYCEVRELR